MERAWVVVLVATLLQIKERLSLVPGEPSEYGWYDAMDDARDAIASEEARDAKA